MATNPSWPPTNWPTTELCNAGGAFGIVGAAPPRKDGVMRKLGHAGIILFICLMCPLNGYAWDQDDVDDLIRNDNDYFVALGYALSCATKHDPDFEKKN